MIALDGRRVVDLVQARLEQHREALREYFAGAPVPPGLESPDDDTFAAFIAQKVKEYPPVPLLFPVLDAHGMPVPDEFGVPAEEERVVSPWIACLYLKRRDPETGRLTAQPLVDGAEAIVRRIERLAAKGLA